MSEMHDDDDHVACARHARPSGEPDGGESADAARVRLAGLQHGAAEAYAAITAADAALQVLAGHRVAAERALRLAAARHQAASRAAAVHARARPGPFARLATRFRAEREWRRQRPALESALADAERQLTAARQALSRRSRTTSPPGSPRGRRRPRGCASLTAECAAALARIAAAATTRGRCRGEAARPRTRTSGTMSWRA